MNIAPVFETARTYLLIIKDCFQKFTFSLNHWYLEHIVFERDWLNFELTSILQQATENDNLNLE